MSKLEQAILKHTDVTASELRQAQLEFPICGTIEALARKLGLERSTKFIAALCEWLTVPLFTESEPVLDQNLYNAGGERLLWLITAYRALPIVYKTESGHRTIQLAMADPFDQRAIRAFETFCQAPVSVTLAREILLSTILEKVCGKSFYAPTSRIKMSAYYAQKYQTENGEAQTALQELFTTATKNAAQTIELELDREFTRAVFLLPFDRTDTIELKVQPETLAKAVVERGQIQKRDEKNFWGSSQVELGSSLITFSLEYHQRHLNRAGDQGQGIVMSQLTNNPLEDPNFWQKLSEEAAVSLRSSLADNSGIYLAVVQKSEQVLKLVSALGQVSPTLSKAYAVAALKQAGELAQRAKFSPVLVALQGKDVVTALTVLSKVPQAVRGLIKGIITYSEVPKACPFCGQRCQLGEETTALIPQSLGFDSADGIYPRGCNYCEQTGYLGEQSLVSFIDRSGALNQVIENGSDIQAISLALSKDKHKDFLEQAIDAVRDATTTIEALARDVYGRQDIDQKRTLSVGKVIIGSSGEVLGIGGDKSTTVGGNQPTASMIGHHSVVLDMGFDLMAARDAIRAEGEAAFGSPSRVEEEDDSEPLPLSSEQDFKDN